MSGIKSSHSTQDVEKSLRGICLPVPGLPKVEDGLGGTGPGGEEGDIAVDIEPLGQHPPVVAEADRGVQHPAERLLGGTRQTEGEGAAVGLSAGASAGARPQLQLSISADAVALVSFPKGLRYLGRF